MKSDTLYIQQVCDAISKIETYASDMTYEQFCADDKTQSAVIMQLIIIGELTKKISDVTKQKIDLPWKDIAGFRDVAVHEYFHLDLEIVWNTIAERLPEMKEKLCSVNLL
ncbi:MAG: DUF86 domain-containing protein [Candidatus Yonathbacteria bacterium]|nr:DUF86 domain-containing protein [Candidatus Yonathbacteria bacterium]